MLVRIIDIFGDDRPGQAAELVSMYVTDPGAHVSRNVAYMQSDQIVEYLL